ncbi:NHLP bacteriocin export ABC transporter permease/ATPase subunit [Haliscomenobacter hydrossis]|uniref:NHPM bacteriocin system ABC transporter, ATP-binding protein n=1 Tax=Haliscomenobacter hydrossis (strain ATCC 27775 / DSM 1100 / LMG 10767 / O) TaxID=760192 RepID=F4L1N0_HALH1|nr:NHLP bacteriocin export ABC transporter permease/ATPase subunit [Haliscomenobacter hydrossis]AEE48574.1 NHPM bacteriocin system ABC transporter, ATP-binding protein [Haliscomenobacter hydrossis DSM 1100]
MDIRPTAIILGANRPFFLDKHDHFWIVVNGEAEIYYATRDESGHLTSARHHVYTAVKGDLLLSLHTDDSRPNFNLMAVGADVKLIEAHKSILGILNKDQLSHKISRWVNSLAAYIHQGNGPKIYQDLSAVSGPITLQTKGVAFPARELRWAKICSGGVHHYGSHTDRITAAEAKHHYLPVSRELWVEATEKNTILELIDTRSLVEDEISLMLSVHKLLAYFQRELQTRIESRYAKASRQIQAKAEADEQAIERSLGGLKGIVSPSADSVVFNQISNNNPLLAACQLIGQKVGFEFKEPKFIRDFEHNLTGQLASIAQVSEVRTRKVILRGRWWEEENGHLLAFLQDSMQPVALIQGAGRQYSLQNPTDHTSIPVTEEVAHRLQPTAYMFLYSFQKQISSIKQIGQFAMKGLRADGAYIIIAALAGSLIGLLTPLLSGVLFDDVIPQADRSFLWEVFAIMLVIALVRSLLDLTKGILFLRLETKSNINVQAGLMDHLLRLPVTFFRRFSAGDLTVRALGINSIRQILSNTVLTTVLSGAFSIVNLFLLFYYDSRMAWVGVGLALLAVVFIGSLGYLKLRYDRQVSNLQGNIQGFLFEFLSGINKIRISGSEKRVFSLWANQFGQLKELGFHSGNYQNFVEVFKGSYPILTNMVFFGFILYTLTHATDFNSMISVGVFMAFLTAFNQFLNDCLNMSMGLISSLNIVPMYERLKPILEATPESTENNADPGELAGEIEFNSVNFRYDPDQPLILKDVSFKIKPGEMIAFVGPSGSGKSTVMRLLLGFEEPESGSIYYDGQAFDSLNKEQVRRQLGVVLQHGSLMPGGIYQNIVGSSELTLEDAEEAAAMAGLKEDIEQMPMGMHTVISEGGSTFSGGQRQRLMIARAIVHKPRILFMDEATSALDNRTQTIVSESLDRLQATRIVVAHRLSTIVNADRIFVMDAGRIVESGTYDELLAQNGLFAALAKRQIA